MKRSDGGKRGRNAAPGRRPVLRPVTYPNPIGEPVARIGRRHAARGPYSSGPSSNDTNQPETEGKLETTNWRAELIPTSTSEKQLPMEPRGYHGLNSKPRQKENCKPVTGDVKQDWRATRAGSNERD